MEKKVECIMILLEHFVQELNKARRTNYKYLFYLQNLNFVNYS